MKNLLLLLFSILTFQAMLSQVVCGTNAHSSNRNSNGPTIGQLHSPTGPADMNAIYCVRIYAHKIADSNGSSVSDQYINNQIDYLNNNFGGNVNFVMEDPILTITNNSIYNSTVVPDPPFSATYDFSPLNAYSPHNDGIDLYFFDHSIGAAGVANGIANESQVVLSFLSQGGNSSDTIIHEIGHVLGLFHTYHSTIGSGSANPENNDGYGPHDGIVECPEDNPITWTATGDFVNDTPADRSDITGYDPINCIVLQQGLYNTQNCGSQPFPSIQANNFMKDTPYFHTMTCNKFFTPGQHRRMVYFLNTFLTDLLKDCPPTICETCVVTENAAILISNTFEWNEDCTAGSLSFTFPFPFVCPNETYLVEWDGGSAIMDVSNGSTFPINMNFNGNDFEYSISPQRETISCGPYFYTPPPCDNAVCGFCGDDPSDFPVLGPSNVLSSQSNIIGKTITTDCSGNIYTLGQWDAQSSSLRKMDNEGNAIWTINNVFPANNTLLRNVIMEVDDLENVYIKYGGKLMKYFSNGSLAWNVTLENSLFSSNSVNIGFNKSTGATYIPYTSSTTITNSDGSNTSISLGNSEDAIVTINTGGISSIVDVFNSNYINNIHFNEGLHVWYKTGSGISYRKYEDNVLTQNNLFLSNFFLNQFNQVSPLFFNHLDNTVYVFTTTSTTSNTPRIRIMSTTGATAQQFTLPQALYSSMQTRGGQSAYSFNTNSGALAIYADGLDSAFGSPRTPIISTIHATEGLNVKQLETQGQSAFYSRSFHAISYSDTCLYFYGSYRSNSGLTLNDNITLPSSGFNSRRSTVIRLQGDLEIRTSELDITEEKPIVMVKNPVSNNQLEIEFAKSYNQKIQFELYRLTGEIIAEEEGYLLNNRYSLKFEPQNEGIVILKITYKNGTIIFKKILVTN